jgi:hypothetical protein
MSYAQGDKIDASDYNNLLNGSNQLNTVWGVGTGNAGYGQTALSTVSQSGTITATQWATLINTLNSIRTHQSGAGSGISAVTAGAKIDWISTLQTQVNSAYTNRLSFAASGTTVTGTNLASAWTSGSTGSTLSGTWGARCAFASANAARYFFNAGGRLKFNFSASGSNGSGRSNGIVALAGFMGGVNTFGQTTNGGRSGSGGTLNTNNTALGYWNVTYDTNTTIVAVTNTTAAYTSDTASIYVRLTGTRGANGDNGVNVDFYGTMSSTSGTNGPGAAYSFDDSLSVTVNRSIDVLPPSATNLTNTWGTPTISAL